MIPQLHLVVTKLISAPAVLSSTLFVSPVVGFNHFVRANIANGVTWKFLIDSGCVSLRPDEAEVAEQIAPFVTSESGVLFEHPRNEGLKLRQRVDNLSRSREATRRHRVQVASVDSLH